MTKHFLLKIAPGITLVIATAFLMSCHEEAKTNQSLSQSSRASLFTVPADQMSHVEVYTVQPQALQRVLRLTGAVAYNAFKTTPVISAVGGPVARIVVAPGIHVKRGQPMLYVS